MSSAAVARRRASGAGRGRSRFEQYHDRAPLVLERGDDAAWLDSPAGAKALFTAPKKLPRQIERATV